MLSFERIDYDHGPSLKVIFNGLCVAIIDSSGSCFMLGAHLQLDIGDIDILRAKMAEVIKFGIDKIPTCEFCGGTTAFPQNNCEAGNHGLLYETTST